MKLSEQTIKRLNNSKEGEELKKFLTDKISSLDRVSDIPNDWDDRQKAIEVSAKKRAVEILAKMLAPILGYSEPVEIEKPEIY